MCPCAGERSGGREPCQIGTLAGERGPNSEREDRPERVKSGGVVITGGEVSGYSPPRHRPGSLARNAGEVAFREDAPICFRQVFAKADAFGAKNYRAIK